MGTFKSVAVGLAAFVLTAVLVLFAVAAKIAHDDPEYSHRSGWTPDDGLASVVPVPLGKTRRL
jgi:hypothetical protein